jgi:hypothetical protein
MDIPTSSSKAQDRELAVWYRKLQDGEIKLPRFQRFEAWDRNRVCSFLNTIIHNLPVGVTLILEVGDEEKFESRYLKTAPENGSRVGEHLLDGQQRLTAFWRSMNSNYRRETYYVYLPEFDQTEDSIEEDEVFVYCQPRWDRNGTRYPMWADNEAACLRKGLIPVRLLRPEDVGSDIDEWISKATKHLIPDENCSAPMEAFSAYHDTKEKLKDVIRRLREVVTHYNLPYLALPPKTHKDTALNVFINMNTNSKPLSLFDIIVAEVEGIKGQSLHDLQSSLEDKISGLGHLDTVSRLLLTTAALLQDKVPNERGMLEMNKAVMIDKWNDLERGLSLMNDFINRERIFDRQRLPTTIVLPVIAALYTHVPEAGDARGSAETLFRKYLWTAFFTDRYENGASSRAFADYRGLKGILTGVIREDGFKYDEGNVPAFNHAEYPLANVESLLTAPWPKNQTIIGRALLAVTIYLGAFDFADGTDANQVTLRNREYHHIFPDALLKEAKIDSFLALNCALISGPTNRSVGRKDPLTYMKERYEWASDDIVHQRLNSHLIPIKELANGGYDILNNEEKMRKIKNDFECFLIKRANLMFKAMQKLVKGQRISSVEILGDTDVTTNEHHLHGGSDVIGTENRESDQLIGLS